MQSDAIGCLGGKSKRGSSLELGCEAGHHERRWGLLGKGYVAITVHGRKDSETWEGCVPFEMSWY